MSITISTYEKWAISRNGGSTWLNFPKGPTVGTEGPTPSTELVQRIDGTFIIPMFWNVPLRFGTMTKKMFYDLMAMYNASASNQPVEFNYRGIVDTLPPLYKIWFHAPAVFGKPPTWTPGPDNLFYDVRIELSDVEWYIPNS